MTHFPLQSFGIGDCIFTAALGKHWVEQGDRVIWGVEPQFVDGLTRAYPFITYLDKRLLNIDYNCKTQAKYADGIIEPIRWSDTIMRVPYDQVMRAKYDMYGLDWNMWRGVMYERDIAKERRLYAECQKVVNNSNMFCLSDKCIAEFKYNLISPYYGTGSQFRAQIEPNNGLPNVYMSSLPGYSLFDWSLVIENATNIYAVSSSIVYLLELLNLKAESVHLYGRHHEKDTWYKNIEYILTKHYKICE